MFRSGIKKMRWILTVFFSLFRGDQWLKEFDGIITWHWESPPSEIGYLSTPRNHHL